jgi:methyl-accepting chemotaxis protein
MTLEQIVASVKKVSDIVAEIAAASREQSSGIEQVNRAIMQMDELTQQNAALVEQATASSQAMAQQAGELNEMMGTYSLSESLAAVVKAPVPRPSAAPAAQPPAPQSERRAANRPWSGRAAKAAAPAADDAPVAQAGRKRAEAASGDSDWREF